MKASVIASLVTFLAASATAAPMTASEFRVPVEFTGTNGTSYGLTIPADHTTVYISMLLFPLVTNAYTFRSKANK